MKKKTASLQTMESRYMYFVALKAGIQPWTISSKPFTLTDNNNTVVGQYISTQLFSINIPRHHRKVDWLFAVIRVSNENWYYDVKNIRKKLDRCESREELYAMDELVIVCKMCKRKIAEKIQRNLKKMRKYYTSMSRTRVHHFSYLKHPKHAKFTIDINVFEDIPDSDFDLDASFNSVKKYSVSFTQPHFSFSY